LGSATEIHDRKLDEQALWQREEHYRQLLLAGRDALFVYPVDADGTPQPFVEVNDEACRRYGYRREEFLQRCVFDITTFPPDQLRANIRTLLEGGKGEWETFHRTRDGRLIPTEVYAQAVTLEGRPHIIFSARDIAERRRAESARRESEELFRAIIDNSPSVIYLKDLDGRYLLTNARVAELFQLR